MRYGHWELEFLSKTNVPFPSLSFIKESSKRLSYQQVKVPYGEDIKAQMNKGSFYLDWLDM
jgi:hypothetical protein